MEPVTKDNYFLVTGRLLHYKNVDTVIDVFNRRSERLIVVGDGPMKRSLMRMAHPNITFKGFVPDNELSKLYQQARALVFSPSYEDFGITMVESLASGTPVIALHDGGAAEILNEGETGVIYAENTPESLNSALDQFLEIENSFNAHTLINSVSHLGKERFSQELEAIVMRNPSESDTYSRNK